MDHSVTPVTPVTNITTGVRGSVRVAADARGGQEDGGGDEVDAEAGRHGGVGQLKVLPRRLRRQGTDSSAELIGSLKLGNARVFFS